jgi:anaerobic magnesium-protoporphyrin IX monomethyl ester cyclase
MAREGTELSAASDAAVLLINPRMCGPSSTRLPLSLLSLAAVLERRYPWQIVDGNLEVDPVGSALAALDRRPHRAVGVSVMPGPQVAAAIEISAAIRARHPTVPIIWGGYFATLYPDAAINAAYVDYVVRGQGEHTLIELLERIPAAGPPTALDSARNLTAISDVAGTTYKAEGKIRHNPNRSVVAPQLLPSLPYQQLPDIDTYLRPSFLGSRTAVHQAALGCRFKCDFCGVASMWKGETVLDAPERALQALQMLRDRHGANAVQFYDHNFFDREDTSIAMLDALGKLQLPWWCYARADTLARFSASTWEKIRRSRLRMAYIGAEAASNEVLNRMRKGSKVEHTLEVAVRCAEYDVIPEFSFVLGGPDDPDGEVENTFSFIRRIKELNPSAEVILYLYSPMPQPERSSRQKSSSTSSGAHLPILTNYGPSGPPMPTTPEEWTQPQWVRWVCHEDAPWMTPRVRQRIRDFARVLACRFPTAQDYRTPPWGKQVLSQLARWRYTTRRYGRPWELKVAQRLMRLREPQRESL